MTVAVLGPVELTFGAGLVLASAGLSMAARMGLERRLVQASLRMGVQLLCVGYLLRIIIRQGSPLVTGVVLLGMLAVAAHEVGARQGGARQGGRPRGGRRWADYAANLVILALSAGLVSGIALSGLGGGHAPVEAQQVIPIFGIVLGTAMNSASLTLHALGAQVHQMRPGIEARLALGHSFAEATRGLSNNAITAGTIPILNQMAGAGIITLPGIMSGQILAGQDPMQAALYQIFLMTLLAGASVICVAVSVWLFRRRISDERQRLRLDRL